MIMNINDITITSLETITVASRLECCGVSGIGGGTVAVIECPAMVYLDGSQIVDQVKAIIAVTPCTTIAYGIVRISGMLYMEAETVYITSIVTLAIVVVVVIGVTIDNQIVFPCSLIIADGHSIMHGNVLNNTVGALSCRDALGLGVPFDAHGDTNDVEIAEVQIVGA